MLLFLVVKIILCWDKTSLNNSSTIMYPFKLFNPLYTKLSRACKWLGWYLILPYYKLVWHFNEAWKLLWWNWYWILVCLTSYFLVRQHYFIWLLSAIIFIFGKTHESKSLRLSKIRYYWLIISQITRVSSFWASRVLVLFFHASTCD